MDPVASRHPESDDTSDTDLPPASPGPAVPDAAKAVYRSWGPGFYDPRFNIDGKRIWQIGFPIHWGYAGARNHTGPLANMLTPTAMDPNTWTPEYKAFLVRLEKA